MSKKPTGITISRNAGKYAVSWKCGDKNYGSGQQFQYRINGGKWTSKSVSAGARSATVSVNLNNYCPYKEVEFVTLEVRIRGKKKKSSWSSWAPKTYTNSRPDVPNLESSLDDQQTNTCTFTWNETTEITDEKPFAHVKWETILVRESDISDGKDLVWDSSSLGWDTGSGSSASSITKTEDTTLLAEASYTRWVRVRGEGAGGSSDWRYAKHVYARPFQAQIEFAEISDTGAEGLTGYVQWTADQTPSHPIDHTTVQYLITVPNSGLTCPSGAQWNDANISADTEASDAVRFSIDDVLDKDECLFVRVNTIHDSNITYSNPALASIGELKDPVDLSYDLDNTNHTLTRVSVDNESDVPDSFIVLVYRSESEPEEKVIGIIPHGASQPLILPVQCPDWSEERAFSIGAYAAVGSYERTEVGYTVNVRMRSRSTIWVGGAVPVAPENVNVVQSPITGTATVTWDWTWAEATFAQLSWTDHADAWESTDEPEVYTISKTRATKWNISGLEVGTKWYIAVRLVSGNPNDETAIYGPWSKLTDITLSSVPNVPSLNLSSNVIIAGEKIIASWDFVSNDGTGQISAEIRDENDNLIAHTTNEKEVTIDTGKLTWSEGEVHSLRVSVTSESRRTTGWSNPVSIVIAEALNCSISNTSLEADSEVITADGDVTVRYFNSLTEMPLTVELSGVNADIVAMVTIKRTADYHMDRPDETQFDGFEGEIVYKKVQSSDDEIVINVEDLIGRLDDGAPYKIMATFKEVYGQSIQESINFEVHWNHQALIPGASCEIDEENLVAVLTPIAPSGTQEGDTCDIYRLSADRPELIVKDAIFGTEYVDPYPAIGEFGGHRFVFKTKNGDYITEDYLMAMTDTGEEEGDILNVDRTIIDFDGNQLLLYYNVDVGHEWEKDSQRTKYLGGSVDIDWNAGVSRSGSVSATMITLTDREQILLMRELAEYIGACHIRTKDGSSFTADIQVSEDRDHSDFDAIATFSMTITGCDAETLDGLTFEQWSEGEEEE